LAYFFLSKIVVNLIVMSTSKNSSRKPWQTKEWKEKRDKFLKGESCEWCSSNNDLVIHHKKHFYDNWEYNQIAFYYFTRYFEKPSSQAEHQRLKKDAEKQVMPEYVKSCPKCGNSGISPRTTMKPIYRCSRCSHEFDIPERKIHQKTKSQIRKIIYQSFLEAHKKKLIICFQGLRKKLMKHIWALKT